MGRYVKFKRWRLRPGHDEAELVALVREEIEPRYRQLDGCLGLGLLRIDSSGSYLALQYGSSEAAWQAATTGAGYTVWLRRYEPVLARWGQIMELEAEWDAHELSRS